MDNLEFPREFTPDIILGILLGVLLALFLRWLIERYLFKLAGDDVFIPEKKQEKCKPKWLHHLEKSGFYNTKTGGKIKTQADCNANSEYEVGHTISVPIYWGIVGNQWTTAQAQQKIEEAKTYYANYCINLQFYEISFIAGEQKLIGDKFLAEDAKKVDRKGEVPGIHYVGNVYGALWKRVGSPRQLLMVLFTGDYKNMRFDGHKSRITSVSANFSGWPLMLIPHLDKDSNNILTHELTHALGKKIVNKKGLPKTKLDPKSKKLAWEENPCNKTAIANFPRTDPTKPYNLPGYPNRLLDFAEYWNFKRTKNIKD